MEVQLESISHLVMDLMVELKRLSFILKAAVGAVVMIITLFCKAVIADQMGILDHPTTGKLLTITITFSELIELKISFSVTGTESLLSTAMVEDIKAILRIQSILTQEISILEEEQTFWKP